MSNNSEQVTVDLDRYLELKQQAANNQVLNVVVQVAAYVMGKPFQDALKGEGILIEVSGNSLETTEVMIDTRNFQVIQEMKQQAFKKIKDEAHSSRSPEKVKKERSSRTQSRSKDNSK